MRYIFYADIYFIQNFMMKVAALYLSLYCNKKTAETVRVRSLLKICIASLVGTIIEIVGLILSTSYTIFVICVHLFEIPFMTRLILGKEKKGQIRVIVSGYFFTILINGILEVLWNQFGEVGGYICFVLFSCGVVIVGVRIWRNYTKMQKGIFQVQLRHQGKQIQTSGFYDSGNRLRDPYTKKGVHIVSGQILFMLITTSDKEIIEKPVYIPYQSLGNENGMLEVYYIDELIIEGEKGRSIIENYPVGVTKDNLFEGKNYEIILNEEVF